MNSGGGNPVAARVRPDEGAGANRRDYARETEGRVAFIRELVAEAGVRGVVFANSGGKDAALVGILCKMACDDTVGLILPCGVKRNYESDRADALRLGAQYGIAQREVDLLPVREALLGGLRKAGVDSGVRSAENADRAESAPTQNAAAPAWAESAANISIAPRLRMTAVYAVANAENRLVAGTGNRSERHMGYFTKWGDGAFDFNPIADLAATEVFAFLRYLGAPASIVDKAPSAGLAEGQTDESEMGITYAALDNYLMTGEADAATQAIIDRHHRASGHKRKPPALYGETR